MNRLEGFNGTPRKPQVDIVNNVFDDFNTGYDKLIVVAGTGVGKTAAMGLISKHFLKVVPDGIVLIISHLSLLIEQSSKSFMDFCSLPTDVLQADRIPKPWSNCILSTLQSASILDKIVYWRSIIPEGRSVKLILIDEGHINSGTETSDRIVNEFFPEARVVAFTGSPFKANKDMTSLYDKVSYSISLQELIDMGYLVPPVMHGMKVDKKDIESVMTKTMSVVSKYHNKDKCIIFMRTIKEALKMRDIFDDAGYSCAAITAKTDKDDRDLILSNYRDDTEDSHQILITVNVLSLGFDAPAVKGILMPYGTGSVAIYLQRIGRGLRTYEEKTHCDIYIGGNDPKVDIGKFEKIQKKAINAGRRCDNAEQDWEYNKDNMTVDERVTTMETIRLSKAIRKKGMEELADRIVNRQFPREYMEHLVHTDPSARCHKKAKVTIAQQQFLQNRGIDTFNMRRNEAGTLISAICKSEGTYCDRPKVPHGQYSGKDARTVPYSYINLVSREGSKYYNEQLAQYFIDN